VTPHIAVPVPAGSMQTVAAATEVLANAIAANTITLANIARARRDTRIGFRRAADGSREP
jgi:hypothetical protein